MAANRVCAPVLMTWARASPSTTKHPANTASPTAGCSGTLSPVSADVSTARPATLSTVASADIRSPSTKQHHIADDQFFGRNLLRHTVAQYGRPPGQHLSQPFGGMLGAFFLREREDAIEHNDHENRNAQLRQSGEERQSARDPEQQREEVDHLARRGGATRAWRVAPEGDSVRVRPTAGPPARMSGRAQSCCHSADLGKSSINPCAAPPKARRSVTLFL